MGKTSKSWVVPTRSMADKVGETSKGSKGACPLRDNKGVRHDSGGRGGGGCSGGLISMESPHSGPKIN